MGIRRYKPTTPPAAATVSDFADDRGAKPQKVCSFRKKTGGRNNQGKITARHRGNGHKPLSLIDFRRNKDGVPAKVFSIEYDPNRGARIALLH